MSDIIDSLRKAERIELGIAEILRLRAENEKLAQLSAKASQEASQLRAALKPFAELGATLAPAPEDDPPWINWEISHTDLRAARAAMEK